MIHPLVISYRCDVVSLSLEHCVSICFYARSLLQIYTDWANYYLERGGSKKRVTDLQTDLCDGVLLADLVEAVSKYLFLLALDRINYHFFSFFFLSSSQSKSHRR